MLSFCCFVVLAWGDGNGPLRREATTGLNAVLPRARRRGVCAPHSTGGGGSHGRLWRRCCSQKLADRVRSKTTHAPAAQLTGATLGTACRASEGREPRPPSCCPLFLCGVGRGIQLFVEGCLLPRTPLLMVGLPFILAVTAGLLANVGVWSHAAKRCTYCRPWRTSSRSCMDALGRYITMLI